MPAPGRRDTAAVTPAQRRRSTVLDAQEWRQKQVGESKHAHLGPEPHAGPPLRHGCLNPMQPAPRHRPTDVAATPPPGRCSGRAARARGGRLRPATPACTSRPAQRGTHRRWRRTTCSARDGALRLLGACAEAVKYPVELGQGGQATQGHSSVHPGHPPLSSRRPHTPQGTFPGSDPPVQTPAREQRGAWPVAGARVRRGVEPPSHPRAPPRTPSPGRPSRHGPLGTGD
ncbi:MAG: hypothetical protein ACI8PZ_007409, partial [Myxococcota bacterium]